MKDYILMFGVAILLFGAVSILWQYSPFVKQEREKQREQVVNLIASHYWSMPQIELESYKEAFHIKDSEVNPDLILGAGYAKD